jgi:hypothetical protein
MVNWVRKTFLSSRKNFTKNYVKPMKLGEDKDATPEETLVMRKKCYSLHKVCLYVCIYVCMIVGLFVYNHHFHHLIINST